jgi:hypothetical protein
MSQLFILRITPGGKNHGTDQTLFNKSKNIVSIGWSYIPEEIINCNNLQLTKIISDEECKKGKANPQHISYVNEIFQRFIFEMKINDLLLIPRPSTNGHNGTDLYVAKIISDIKYDENLVEKGCAFYREAIWTKNPVKWRTSPYNINANLKDVSNNLMKHMWKPNIIRRTLSKQCNEYIENAQNIFIKYK